MTMIVAIEVLMVTLLLISAVVVGVASLSSTTKRDANSKRALAAASSGLEVARYRLNRMQPANTKCMTDQAVDPGTGGAAAGECPPFTASMGNGVTYKYYVTPMITASGGTCAGTATTAATLTAGQRCITAVGTSGNVTRRAQMLVRGDFTTPIFPLNGMVALSGIAITENGYGDISGSVGTNGTFTLSGCKTGASVTTWDPAPGAILSETCAGSVVTASPARTTAYTLQDITPAFASTEQAARNDNNLWAGAGFNYNAATRALTDNTTSILTLNGPNPRANSGGMYVFNLCSLNFTHAATQINLLNGAVARILIDDSTRSSSGCSSQGTVNITQSSCFNMTVCATPPSPSTPGNASALQIMQYGTARMDITNQAGFSGAIYAPNAEVKFTNKSVFYGGIGSNLITVTNGLGFYSGDLSGVRIPAATALYTRTQPGWVECQAAPTTATDPESGC